MKKMTIITNRRTIVIALVLLALIFLYLGFNESEEPKANQTAEGTPGLMMEEVFSVEASEVVMLSEEKDDIEAPLEGDEFFAEYRLERDRRRAQEIELLQSMYNSPDAINDIKQEAQQKLLELTNSLDLELTLETLVMAKGYVDAVAFVQSGQIILMVRAGEFSDEDATRIADLVSRTTGYPLSKITIFAKK